LILDAIGQKSERFDNDIFAYVNNPLRAGIVHRFIDYRWSSYSTYAYNRRHPKWLDRYRILTQIHGVNKHRQYREKSQKYSNVI
jgi:hypothetical protein